MADKRAYPTTAREEALRESIVTRWDAGAIKLAARTSSRDEDPGSSVTLGGKIIPFTCLTAKKNSFSLSTGNCLPLVLYIYISSSGSRRGKG